MKSTVTYCPEDNKLRLYVGRVPRAEYEALRAAGFTSTPKQDCDFVATWTPRREDLAAEYLEEGEDVGDEDYSPEERAADRAERFDGYRGKRLAEATGRADTFEAGPSAFGHQNRSRAERQAMRHDRHRVRAVSQWSKAEYWQQRTAGVIRCALYKSSASVRRGRILRLEAEQRKHESGREEYAKRFAAWQKVSTLEGAAEHVARAPEGHYGADMNKTAPAGRLAYALANSAGCYGEYTHLRTGRKTSLYSLLTDVADPITPAEAAALWLDGCSDPADENTYSARWSKHYELRLTYENAMLADEGGTAAAVEMEPGGWIRTKNRTGSVFTDVADGWKQIQKVNKSPATGRVVSVQVWGTYTGFTRESGYKTQETRPCLVSVNIERLPEGSYRAPTDEERAAYAEQKKANKKAPVPLINPTDDDAQRLQDLLNARAAENAKENQRAPSPPRPIDRTTQANYSRFSGEDSLYHVCTYSAGGQELFKCRMRRRGFTDYNAAASVVVLADKPQKQIPARYWQAIDAKQPQQEPAELPEEPAAVVAAEAAEPRELAPAGLLF